MGQKRLRGEVLEKKGGEERPQEVLGEVGVGRLDHMIARPSLMC